MHDVILMISDTNSVANDADGANDLGGGGDGGDADRKFAVKARLYQALGVTLSVVRSNLHSPKLLQPAVSVLKLCATDGRLTYSHVVLCACSRSEHTVQLLLGCWLMYLSQTCSNMSVAIKLGLTVAVFHVVSHCLFGQLEST